MDSSLLPFVINLGYWGFCSGLMFLGELYPDFKNNLFRSRPSFSSFTTIISEVYL